VYVEGNSWRDLWINFSHMTYAHQYMRSLTENFVNDIPNFRDQLFEPQLYVNGSRLLWKPRASDLSKKYQLVNKFSAGCN